MLHLLFRTLFPIYFDAAGDGGSGGAGGAGAGGDGAGAGGAGAGGNEPDPDEEEDEDLGEAGKAALAKERGARRAAEKEAKATKAQLAKLQAGAMSEQEKAVAEAKEAGKAEVLSVANERLVRAAVKSAATGKLANPSLAPKLLDLSDFEVDDDGDVDEKAIDAAIAKLVKENPELANGVRKPGALPGSKGGQSNAAQSMNDLIRERAGVTAF